MRQLFLVTLCVIFISRMSRSEEPLQAGMHAPSSIVAEFVAGKWAESKTACPVLGKRDATKVAIFVRRVDEQAIPLIKAVDEIVADKADLQWSFVFVSHENSPTPNELEWDSQVAQLKELTANHQIQHLSLGLMLRNPDNGKPSKARRQLGFFGENDLVIMLIRPNANSNRGVIQYVSSHKSQQLDQVTLDRIRREIVSHLSEKL